MKRTKTGKAWMHEHVTDSFVQRAKAEGYRSRAAFKLMDIDSRDRLIRPFETIIDLGAAPGGWSQVAIERSQGKARVIALDLLEMPPIEGVEFIQGDFRETPVLEELEKRLAGRKVDLVLSDMAPNISGVPLTDQAQMSHLLELALLFAQDWLKPEGALLVKAFQGYGFEDFIAEMRKHFCTVSTRKPEASRDRSAEVYILGRKRK